MPPSDQKAMVAAIVKWMTSGLSEHDIAEQVRTAFPDADPAALLEGAVAHLVTVGTIGPEGLQATFGWALEATKDLFQKCVAAKDFPTALRAVKQIKELAEQAATLP